MGNLPGVKVGARNGTMAGRTFSSLISIRVRSVYIEYPQLVTSYLTPASRTKT